jgi:hypothetical protein
MKASIILQHKKYSVILMQQFIIIKIKSYICFSFLKENKSVMKFIVINIYEILALDKNISSSYNL